MAGVLDLTQGVIDYVLGQAGPYGFGSGQWGSLMDCSSIGRSFDLTLEPNRTYTMRQRRRPRRSPSTTPTTSAAASSS